MDHTPARQNKARPSDALALALAQNVSNLYGSFASNGGLMFSSLNVVRRNNGDWLAVCKVMQMPEMIKLVAFGAGTDFADALQAVNKTIAAARWKVDKPWPPSVR